MEEQVGFITPEEQLVIEDLIDESSIYELWLKLTDICHKKGQCARDDEKDEKLAEAWEKVGTLLDESYFTIEEYFDIPAKGGK